MTDYRLALLGFGNVGQSLARLLLRKRDELRALYDIHFRVTGIATGSHGAAIDPEGIDLEQALALMDANDGKRGGSIDRLSKRPVDLGQRGAAIDFIRTCGADVLFENSPVNYQSGQPAVDHLRTALDLGMIAITANKGPVVHAYRELTRLAEAKGVKFYFESAVMDGTPIFSLFRETLPAAQLLSFRGILNSTTNLILTRMESGESFDQAVAYAQSIGITETDPSGDIDGWDAAVKVAALATVLMDTPLKPDQIRRKGIRGLSLEEIRQARQEGKRWKLVCSAARTEDGIETQVSPEKVGPESPLYNVMGTSSTVAFTTDVLGELTIIENDPGPDTTAYGCLADFINAVRFQKIE
jgi:homoserine dehydrogenase